MTELSMIKSYSHGLQLILNPDYDFESVIKDVCYRFASSRDFFGRADLVLDIEGRDLTQEEITAVVQAIEYNSDVRITIIADNDEVMDARMLGRAERFYFEDKRQNALVIERSLESGEQIRTERSVFVLGDVPEDAIITSNGNIYIWGSLLGTAVCGAPDDDNAFIIAGDMQECAVSVGKHSKEMIPEKKSIFKRNVSNTVIIRYESGMVKAEPFISMEDIR